jgi:hypothetical protein
VVDVELYEAADSPQMRAAVHKMLELLGVHILSEQQVLEEHVLPQLQKAEIQEKVRVSAYLQFMKGVCIQRGKPAKKHLLERVRHELLTRGKRGGVLLPVSIPREKQTSAAKRSVPGEKKQGTANKRFDYSLRPEPDVVLPSATVPIHLPPILSEFPEVVHEFCGAVPQLLRLSKFLVVDMESLFGGDGDEPDYKGWRQLLLHLGCIDFMHPSKCRVPKEALSETLWASKLKLHPKLDLLRSGELWVEDWHSAELDNIFQALERLLNAGPTSYLSPQQIATAFRAVAKFLLAAWPSLESCLITQIGGTRAGSVQLVPSQALRSGALPYQRSGANDVLPSSFASLLSAFAWLPVSHHKEETFMVPEQVFIRSRKVETLCREFVPYVNQSLVEHGGKHNSFWASIGVRSSVDVPSLLEMLREWACLDKISAGDGDASPSPPPPPIFPTCVSHMEAVYRFLAEELELDGSHAADIRSLFLSEPVVWVPSRRVDLVDKDSTTSGKDVVVDGRFYSMDQLCVNEPSFVFEAISGLQGDDQSEAPNNLPRVLAAHYNALTSFFTRFLCLSCRSSPGIVKFGNRGRRWCADCDDTGISKGLERAAVVAFPAFQTYVEALGVVTANKSVEEGYDQCVSILKVFGDTLVDQSQGSLKYGVFADETNFW